MKNQKQTKGAVGHTPGPWRASAHGLIRDAKGFGVAEAYTQHNSDEHEANVRLIAAAPEMLQCLYDLREQLEVIIGDNADLIDMVNRTIARAQGRGE
jgi:hypothetical protein